MDLWNVKCDDLEVFVLKIDQSFMRNQPNSRDIMLRSIVEMAHSLDLEVVCEGVEKSEEVQLLRDLEIDYIQGFVAGAAMSADDRRLRSIYGRFVFCVKRLLASSFLAFLPSLKLFILALTLGSVFIEVLSLIVLSKKGEHFGEI